MTHTFYIAMSYGIAGLVSLCLIGWVWLDGRARRRELAQLEAAGIRRRSATSPAKAPAKAPEGGKA